MALEPRLLELLVDPADQQPLTYFEAENLLYNEKSHRAYDVKNDIPVLLVDESRVLTDDEHKALVGK